MFSVVNKRRGVLTKELFSLLISDYLFTVMLKDILFLLQNYLDTLCYPNWKLLKWTSTPFLLLHMMYFSVIAVNILITI